jgi:hypothetical protein
MTCCWKLVSGLDEAPGETIAVSMWATYLQEHSVAENPFSKQQVPEGRYDDTAQEAEHAKLPCLFTFSRPRIHACHQEDDIERGEGVEYLQGEVP